jgi:hypothetical protein
MREAKNFLGQFSLVSFLFILLFFGIRIFGFGNSLIFEQITCVTVLSTLAIFFWDIGNGGKSWRLGLHSPGLMYKYLCIALIVFTVAQASILNIDRSRSFYVLAWVQEGKVLVTGNQIDLSKVVSAEASSMTSIQTRLIEQSQRGLVTIKEGKYSLTKKGSLVLRISDLIAGVFKLELWAKNRN